MDLAWAWDGAFMGLPSMGLVCPGIGADDGPDMRLA